MGISLTGLASNLDTAKMVQDLMSIERVPYKRLETKKSNLQSEQGIFRNINTNLKGLETALNNLKNSSDYTKLKATSSNTNALSATATSSAQAGNYSIKVKELATAHSVEISGSHIIGQITANKDNVITIGNYTLSPEEKAYLASGDSVSDKDKLTKLADIINKHNKDDSNSSSNASATLLQTTSTGEFKLILQSSTTGLNSKVTFKADEDNLISDYSVGTGDNITPIVKNIPGTDSKLVVNGVEMTRQSNQIDDIISGVTLNLSKASGDETINLTIGRDTEAVVNNIEAFVKAYNSVITQIKDNLAKPTDKDKMNPLQGDSLLKQISSQLYDAFNSMVDIGDPTNRAFMEQIGLSIDKGVTSPSLMTGQIKFDKAAFVSALNENPDRVLGLLTQDKNKDNANAEGVFSKLSSLVNDYTSSTQGLIASKIKGYDTEIKFVDDRLLAMDRSLEMKETRLKLQFSNMETMLSSLKNEQKWLSNQFDALLNTKK